MTPRWRRGGLRAGPWWALCALVVACGRITDGAGDDHASSVTSGDVSDTSAGESSETQLDSSTGEEEDTSGSTPDVGPWGDDCTKGDLYIAENEDLLPLVGVECHLGHLLIDASTVSDLSALSSLQYCSVLHVFRSDPLLMLGDLSGLDALEEVDVLEVLPPLESLHGLEQLHSARVVSIYGAQSLQGLESLAEVTEDLRLGEGDGQTPGPPELVTLEGLESLEHVGDDLMVYGMDKLESLAGLDSLREVGARVQIIENPALTDVSGLAALETAEWFQIQSNPSLPTCAIEDLLTQVNELHPEWNEVWDNLPDVCGG